MKRDRERRNIRVVAENYEGESGFNIYLDFSGKREYLMNHRHNDLLYGMLKDGMSVEDIRRWRPRFTAHTYRTQRQKHYSTVNHLITVIDDYIEERKVM